MKKANQEGNIFFLCKKRPKAYHRTSCQVDSRVEAIMLSKVLSLSGTSPSHADFNKDMGTRISKGDHLFKLGKVIACSLLFISLVLSSAGAAWVVLLPQFGAEALGVMGSFVIITGGFFSYAILFDYKTALNLE